MIAKKIRYTLRGGLARILGEFGIMSPNPVMEDT